MGQRDRIRDLNVHKHNHPHNFPYEQTLVQLQMVYLLTIPPWNGGHWNKNNKINSNIKNVKMFII